MVRTDRPNIRDPFASVLSDSKGLYDAMNNELPQDDKKSATETPIIEEMLSRMNGRLRWIPHNKNPSDGLTKIKGAHMDPLMDLLRTRYYTLVVEEIELENRAKQKEASGGNVPRHKSSGKHVTTNCFFRWKTQELQAVKKP